MPNLKFLTDPNGGRKFRIDCLHPSTRLPNKPHLHEAFHNHMIYHVDQLPPSADLRPEMPPVEDQSQIGSCSANALAGAYEYITKKSDGVNIALSRLFIYYNGRSLANPSTITDSGCTMTDGIEALEEFGVCLESFWPYDISKVNVKPDAEAYTEAKGHTITSALHIAIGLEQMKSCLAQGFPFVFGLKLYKSFGKATNGGHVPMPSAQDHLEMSIGGHALVAVGYNDHSKVFIVRNSWGENWGDKGYCYIPYHYLANSEYCFDAWTIRKLATDDFGQDHWGTNDPINAQVPHDEGLDEVAFEIEETFQED